MSNWHVPIDDERHWKYMLVFSREAPLDKEKFRRRYAAEIDSNYWPVRNPTNRYLQDRAEMKNKTFAGMGLFFAEHDLFATESMGPIRDRTQEHLGHTDKAIIAARRLLLKMIRKMQQDGEPRTGEATGKQRLGSRNREHKLKMNVWKWLSVTVSSMLLLGACAPVEQPHQTASSAADSTRTGASAPSVDYQVINGTEDIGVIASVTEPFCSSCTRARLTADGRLVTCLFSARGHYLKALIRNGASDEKVRNVISVVWRIRTDRYSDARLEVMKSAHGYEAKAHKQIEMITLGV